MVEGEVELKPNGAAVSLNGETITRATKLTPGDIIHTGAATYTAITVPDDP